MIDKRAFIIEKDRQVYRKYTDIADWVVYSFHSGDFADGYHLAHINIWHSLPDELDAVLHPDMSDWTFDQKAGYSHGINVYMPKWYAQQHRLWLAEQGMTDTEEHAQYIANNTYLLRKRLYEARAVLDDRIRPYFDNCHYDFENKRLVGDNDYYIQWYENGTRTGGCEVKKFLRNLGIRKLRNEE